MPSRALYHSTLENAAASDLWAVNHATDLDSPALVVDLDIMEAYKIVRLLCLGLICCLVAPPTGCQRSPGGGQVQYEIVIRNGRVIDPETELDSVGSLGITDGVIRVFSTGPLTGTTTIDATGLVVSPGFIDLHAHGQDAFNNQLQARDGVTSALELEIGTNDVEAWYREREGNSLIHHGVSVGHIPIRMDLMEDAGPVVPSGPAAHRAATEEEIEQIKRELDLGLEQGAVALGLGIQYTPAASRHEILEAFRVASSHESQVHVHMRHMGSKEPGSEAALQEVLAAATITGAGLHVVHITSMGLDSTLSLLEMIEGARDQGMDVSTEFYPYRAALTGIHSAIFEEGWQEVLGIDYQDLEWVATGERLTQETFAKYRPAGGWVVMHMIPEAALQAAIERAFVLVASDGVIEDGKGHPRSAGTYSRVLGHLVREQGGLTLMEAIRRMALLPAQRLEARIPGMKSKGRLQVGADADITVFDPERVIDRATYQDPTLASEGIRYVLVNGTLVVKDGHLLEGFAPGRAIRAPRD